MSAGLDAEQIEMWDYWDEAQPTPDDHRSCKNCGFDLNGKRVYDYFLREYDGDVSRATETASMYGCREGWGRFGKEVYTKGYDDKYKPITPRWVCPECKEECY